MNKILHLDSVLFRLLHRRWRKHQFDPIMIWFTRAGTKGVIWLGIGAGLLFGSNHSRLGALLMLLALLLAEGVINLVLKPAIRRQRPYEHHGLTALLVNAPGPHSWPSAHAGSSVAAGSVLFVWYFPQGTIFIAIALVIAYSRIYVGVHYPLDVLAGIIIGAASAAAVLLVFHLAALPFGL